MLVDAIFVLNIVTFFPLLVLMCDNQIQDGSVHIQRHSVNRSNSNYFTFEHGKLLHLYQQHPFSTHRIIC